MKANLFLSALFLSSVALAQTVDVKGVDTNSDKPTTIRIQKGDQAVHQRVKWEIQEGTGDVEGETSATGKDAKQAWKKACDDWKKEIREDNKENKVISLSCGTSTCGGEAGSKVCSSKGVYKIKTQAEVESE